MKNLRTLIIDQAVKNMHEFGYSHVNSKNILTDEVYKQFFLSMLKTSLCHESDLCAFEALSELITEVEK